jgi:hypothetical protein
MNEEMIDDAYARMTEAEVSLRLAFHLLIQPGAVPSITVCLDRHHVLSGGKVIFPVHSFLSSEGWVMTAKSAGNEWLGTYAKNDNELIVSPDSRGGDVVARIGKKQIRAECKKGFLQRKPGNPENRLIHEAIGQLMTVEEASPDDVLIVAVPLSAPHRSKVVWQSRPLMRQARISIVLVGRDGTVEGMPSLS